MIDFLLSFPLFATVLGIYLIFLFGTLAARRFPTKLPWFTRKPLLFGLAVFSYFAAVWLFNLGDIYRPGVNAFVIYLKLASFQGVTPPAAGNMIGLSFAAIFVISAFAQKGPPPAGKKETERGSHLVPFEEAKKRAEALAKGKRDLITWAGLLLPVSEAARHFAVSGTTQSGKSVTIKRLMLDVLPLVGKRGYDYRALIYDYKLDFLPFAASVTAARTVTFNPFHPDCVAWDIAADVTTKEEARQVAAILVPKNEGDGGDSRFFLNSTQAVFEEIMTNFIRRGVKDWTFRDVICAMRDLPRLTKFLKTHPDTALAITSHGHEKTLANVFSDVSTYRKRYEIVAALWHAPSQDEKRRVGLSKWAKENFVIVLQAAEEARETLDAINRVILQRAQKALTGSTAPQPPVSDTRKSWIFLDEATEAGRLDGLGDLLRVGQGYGVSVVLGFQDIEGMRALYETQKAHELVGLCANKTFVRTDSEPHAEWASSCFGKRVVIREMRSTQLPNKPFSGDEERYSLGEQRQEEAVVMAAEISQIPDPKTSGVLRSYNIIPAIANGKTDHGSFCAEVSLAAAVKPFPTNAGGFKPRPASEQWLIDWDASDIDRLKLPGDFLDPEPSPTGASTKPKPEKPAKSEKPEKDTPQKKDTSDADPLDSIERREF